MRYTSRLAWYGLASRSPSQRDTGTVTALPADAGAEGTGAWRGQA